MKNLPVVKLAWVLGQGLFLPTVLWLDDVRSSGNYWGIAIFLLLEVMYVADAFLFLHIFKGSK